MKIIDYKANGNDVKVTIKSVTMHNDKICSFFDRHDENLQCDYIKFACIFQNIGLVVYCAPDYAINDSLMNALLEHWELFFEATEKAAKENGFIKETTIELYRQLNKPFDHLIKSKEAFRAEKLRQDNEKLLKQMEERERAEKEEKERLSKEAEKYKAGEKIDAQDFLQLCKDRGIKLHARTIGQINDCVRKIGYASFTYTGKGKSFNKIMDAQNELLKSMGGIK